MFFNLFHGLRKATKTWRPLNSYRANCKVILVGDTAMRALGH